MEKGVPSWSNVAEDLYRLKDFLHSIFRCDYRAFCLSNATRSRVRYLLRATAHIAFFCPVYSKLEDSTLPFVEKYFILRLGISTRNFQPKENVRITRFLRQRDTISLLEREILLNVSQYRVIRKIDSKSK